jgi:hypothetical protein
VAKGDSVNREEYERDIKQREAAAAASNAAGTAARAVAAAEFREFQRRGEPAFPEGPGSVAPASATDWLTDFNRDRAAVGLQTVAEDSALSDGDLKHAKYVVMNYPTRTALGEDMHSEDPSKPGYTAEGLAAARQSDVAPYWYNPSSAPPPPTTPSVFLNTWLTGPFHRPSILFPALHKVGFGEFCQDRACVAALNASEWHTPVAGPIPFAQAVVFPPEKYPVDLVRLQNEWPDPTSPCSGYAVPVGLPVTIQLGTNLEAKLSSYAFSRDSKPVEACGYDSTTYVNPNPADQKRGRDALRWNGQVVIIPKKPLDRGASYQVSATVNDHPYNWSFTVSK